MPHVLRDARKLLGLVIVTFALSRARAADTDNGAPTPAPAEFGAPTSEAPAYWNQQQPPAQPVATNQSHESSEHISPTIQYPERTVAAMGEAAAVTLPAAPQANSAQRPLPLGPPAAGAHGEVRSREMAPLVTGAASLGIVLGLFLLVVWVARRGMPKSAAILPREAFEILGRAPLVARQHVHLLRCGHKILLVYVSPTGAETLTEISDPAEVERLIIACQGPNPGGSPFRQMLQQFGKPPRDRRYSARHESGDLNFAHLENASSGA